MSTSIQVEGLDALVAKLKAQPLIGDALKQGLDAAGLLIQTQARKRAPVDHGRLRASILYQLHGVPTTEVRVGANVNYAPFMEYGTGRQSDGPQHSNAHFPPPQALEGWAGRHGTSGFAVAMAIARRGGLKPRRFLRGALEDNEGKVITIIRGAIKRAEKNFNGG